MHHVENTWITENTESTESTENRGSMGKIDRDAVVRAQVLLLGTHEPPLRQLIDAYRILAEVGPLTYLPKLSGALHSLGCQPELRARPDLRLRSFAEALAIARLLGEDEPKRERLFRQALSGYERTLFALGRRAEGLVACEELGAFAPSRFAAVLAEEGRHEEAAELHEAAARAERAQWPHRPDAAEIAWAAELDAAGRHEQALTVFAGLVEAYRRAVGAGETPPGGLAQRLSHHAWMLDASGRHAEARSSRREALTVVGGLTRSDEAKRWSRDYETWAGLLALSGRADEPAPTPDAPMPALGTEVRHWSADAREAFAGSVPALEEEAVRLRDAGLPRELLTVHRRLTVRRALFRSNHFYRFAEEIGPLVDEGVALARRLPDGEVRLGRALTDRAMFRLAATRYAEAHTDLVEAVALLDGS
ncbi:hypothetical protein [Streptomyces sp. NPDC051921]|uniref:hypothetical protein n=1 Tax=Streptomyces sp. NPDC051921 TaxID=3155806 RepID=UPI003412625A